MRPRKIHAIYPFTVRKKTWTYGQSILWITHSHGCLSPINGLPISDPGIIHTTDCLYFERRETGQMVRCKGKHHSFTVPTQSRLSLLKRRINNVWLPHATRNIPEAEVCWHRAGLKHCRRSFEDLGCIAHSRGVDLNTSSVSIMQHPELSRCTQCTSGIV